MPVDQCRRQGSVPEQGLFAVEVAQYRVEQAGALLYGAGQFLPFVGAENQRQRIEFPRSVGAFGICIDVVGDAVLEDAPTDVVQPVAHLFRRRRVEVRQERLPGAADAAVFGKHLVEAIGLLQVG